MIRRLLAAVVLTASCSPGGEAPERPDKPNFVIVLADDQGYGDVGRLGSTRIRTPRIDRLAREGLTLTSFYTQTVCASARAALMTGSYPNRVMPHWDLLDGSYVTLAETLQAAGYTTGLVGKWDLSGRMQVVEGSLPTDQGFDYFFGTLASNDFGWVTFMEGSKSGAPSRDMAGLTGLYTDKALEFIEARRQEPFFLLLSHSMPHVVIDASEQFKGRSEAGLYGDAIEEIDWNLGRLVDRLRDLELDRNTYLIYTSDNGPWLAVGENGGSAGPLRMGKGSAWEGGFRVPFFLWAPGRVPAGLSSDEPVASLDLLPTLAHLAGAELPTDRVIDGRNQVELFSGRSEASARDTFYYYVMDELHAVRKGRWKLALPDREKFWPYATDPEPVLEPELYDLKTDPSEARNVADRHPEVVAALLVLAEQARSEIGDADRAANGSGRSR